MPQSHAETPLLGANSRRLDTRARQSAAPGQHASGVRWLAVAVAVFWTALVLVNLGHALMHAHSP